MQITETRLKKLETGDTPLQQQTAVSPAPASVAGALTTVPIASQTGTLSITLTQAPPPPTPLLENLSFWGPVIAFVGVLITVISAHLRMKEELKASEDRMRVEREHNRKEAQYERRHSQDMAHDNRITEVRHEAYLEAVSELVKAHTLLASLPSRDIKSLETGEPLCGLITAVGKITILGVEETVLRARVLNDAINSSFIGCMAEIVPMARLKDEIARLEEALNSAQSEVQRLSAAIKNHYDSNELDRQRFETLDGAIKEQFAKVTEIAQERAMAQERYGQARLAYGRRRVDEAKGMAVLTNELISSVRIELGLDPLDEMLARSTEATIRAVEDAYGDLLHKIALRQDS